MLTYNKQYVNIFKIDIDSLYYGKLKTNMLILRTGQVG